MRLYLLSIQIIVTACLFMIRSIYSTVMPLILGCIWGYVHFNWSVAWDRLVLTVHIIIRNFQINYSIGTYFHSGETDEANCSWLHPVWPPPKRPDQDSTFCAVSRASTELIFCIHRDFDARNNVCKPRRLVCEYCRDISAWKLRVMKPIVFRNAGRMKPTEYRDEANWFSNWADYANCW